MNNAIRKRQNFSNGNTRVATGSFFNNDVYCEESKVFLHGNHIATYDHVTKELALFDGGWQSNTTKSRLNALCYEFATGFGVFQKNWDWFVSDFNQKNVIDFFNGVTVYSDGVFIKSKKLRLGRRSLIHEIKYIYFLTKGFF